LNPQGGQQVMDDILRNTINIPPTISINQGSRVQVIVARDVDFRPVYELRTAAAQ
jgi:type IV secretory pathway VirB10-like protein